MKNNVQVGADHYILEYDQYTTCPKDKATGNYYDPRFYSAGGLKVSELSYMTDNQIFTTLADKAPGFTKFQNVGDSSATMALLELQPWARSTIPWSLKCETDHSMSRESAIHMFNLTLD